MNYDLDTYSKFGEVNISNCDQEPIHIPGSIQPHGILWEIGSQELKVLRVSENIEHHLGWSVAEVLEKNFFNFGRIKNPDLKIEDLFRKDMDSKKYNPVVFCFYHKNGNTLEWEGAVHRSKHGLVIELEFSQDYNHLSGKDLNYESLELIQTLKSNFQLKDLLEYFTKKFREISKYDRVMVYQFDKNWDGEVVAESRIPHLEPYIGLRYPSTDIPRQARELYERNLLRIIPDIQYSKVPIINSEGMDEPLDMSDSILRSVSPIHIEYLQNMGVRGTMTISLLVGGKLWGMVACHHYSPKYISFEFRGVAYILAQFLTAQIESIQQITTKNKKLEFHQKRDKLLQQIQNQNNILSGLMQGEITILDYIPCNGVAILWNDEIHTLGSVPPKEKIRSLVPTIQEFSSYYEIFYTDSIALYNLDWIKEKEVAAGLLAGIVPYKNPNMILFFRGEVVRTVTWAGNPKKSVLISQNAPNRLHPRKSFEAWVEKVRYHCQPWEPLEVEAVEDFLSSFNKFILKRAEFIETLSKEISSLRKREEETNKKLHEKEIFLKEIHHRVKNNFQIILSLLSLQSSFVKDPNVEASLKESKARIQSMAMVHELLFRQPENQEIPIREYLDYLIRYLLESYEKKNLQIQVKTEDIIIPSNKIIPLGLILNELILNSFKYAFPSQEKTNEPQKQNTIQISIKKEKDNYVLLYKDNGIGLPEHYPEIPSKTLGTLLIQNLSHQLNGQFQFWNEDGANFQLTFPIQEPHH